MSGAALAAVTTPVIKPFVLRVGGFDVITSAPLGDFPVHVSETTDGAGQMTFTIEDTASRQFRLGAEVLLIDKRNGDWTLFGGHLVNMRARRRGSAVGRLIDCTAIGYDAWLDWRIVPSWSSVNSKTGSSLDTDRKMVQQIVNKFAGPRVSAPDGTVDITNNSMETVKVGGVTVREAIERIAQTATIYADTPNRSFYVDVLGRLHYYKEVELLPAPYRIADGSYTRTVLATSGLVSLWTMREPSGTTAWETKSRYTGTFAGGAQRGVTGGIPNEPQMRATLLDGSTGYMSASGTNLHPGDTFSFECWFKRRGTGSLQMLWSAATDDFAVRFNADDTLSIQKVPNNIWTTNASFTDTASWHHLVATKDGSTRRIYVDGDLKAGSGTNASIVADTTAINIGRRVTSADRFFDGSIQHAALYDVALSAATVLAHYNQGVSIVPESMVLEMDASDGRERVWVAGAAASTSFYVEPGEIPGVTMRTAFGVDEPQRAEVIERQDSKTVNKTRDYGAAFLKRHNDPIVSGSFSVTGYDGWRVGQRVYFTDTALGIEDYPIDIKQIDTDVLMGNGTIRYDITVGRVPRTGMRVVSRSIRRRR